MVSEVAWSGGIRECEGHVGGAETKRLRTFDAHRLECSEHVLPAVRHGTRHFQAAVVFAVQAFGQRLRAAGRRRCACLSSAVVLVCRDSPRTCNCFSLHSVRHTVTDALFNPPTVPQCRHAITVYLQNPIPLIKAPLN